MLKSMGWTEGTGLGADRKGITQPVNQYVIKIQFFPVLMILLLK